jgi:hypothetical protein
MMINNCCIFINDNPSDQEIFTKAVRDVSPQTLCLTFNNAQDAICILVEDMIVPNYIFIEFDLSKQNGFLEIIQKIESLKAVPVIVHAISPNPNEIIELKESGALAIYFRPYDYWGVCNIINLYFSPDIPHISYN